MTELDATDSIFSFNWYPNEYPNEDDIVLVKKVNEDDLGNWYELLEYGSKEGFSPPTFNRKKTSKKIMYARIQRVDPDGHEIDLSFRYINPQEEKNAKTRFENYKKVMNMLLSTSNRVKHTKFEELIEKVVYPLHNQYDDAYYALKRVIDQPEILKQLDVSDDIKRMLIEQNQKMFMKPEIKIRALFEAEIFSCEGVELLKNALSEGYEVENEIDLEDSDQNSKANLLISVVAPPTYSIFFETSDKEKGLELANKILRKIENKINEYKGRFLLKEDPKVFEKTDLGKNEEL